MKPVIAITPSWETVSEARRYYLAYLYARAVETAGGLPVILPYLDDENIKAVFTHFDGVLLSGGGDVEPGRFGESVQAELTSVVPERDRTELTVATEALRLGLPVLGICRGAQVLNVAYGGTLYQDLPTQRPEMRGHSQTLPRSETVHGVSVAEGSRLAACHGRLDLKVNSFHHQAVKDLAAGLKASAWADDGLIEGFEDPGRPVLGVQWHPECLWEGRPEHLGPFVELVRHAASGPGRQK